MTENALEMLGLLVRHELAIRSLYLTYGEILTDAREFWHGLAHEEQVHAERLEALGAEPKLGVWLTAETRRKSQAVLSSMKYLKDQESRARRDGLTAVQALAVARDIERALIDREFLAAPDPACTEIAAELEALRHDTERHRRIIEEALEIATRLGR